MFTRRKKVSQTFQSVGSLLELVLEKDSAKTRANSLRSLEQSGTNCLLFHTVSSPLWTAWEPLERCPALVVIRGCATVVCWNRPSTWGEKMGITPLVCAVPVASVMNEAKHGEVIVACQPRPSFAFVFAHSLHAAHRDGVLNTARSGAPNGCGEARTVFFVRTPSRHSRQVDKSRSIRRSRHRNVRVYEAHEGPVIRRTV